MAPDKGLQSLHQNVSSLSLQPDLNDTLEPWAEDASLRASLTGSNTLGLTQDATVASIAATSEICMVQRN